MLTQFSGKNFTSPSVTTSSATPAIDWPGKSVPAGAGFDIATNHWSVSIGSTTAPVRPQRGTVIRCGLTDSSRPSAFRSATIRLRAS